MLSIPCKTGKIVVSDDGFVRVQAPFNKILWESPVQDVTGLTVQQGAITSIVTIHSAHGAYRAEMVATRRIPELQAALPDLQTQQAGKEWYHNPTALTYVATYTNDKQMQREMEQAYQHGWQVQGQSAQGGRSSAGKVIGGALIAGPLGALAGAVSKSKDKITVTFVRSPEWMANQQK